MGKRGPKRTPTSILAQRNTRPQQARGNEPQPNLLAPVMPDWLLPNAKQAWRYLAPKMERLGILTEIDGNAFARYCQTWARWRQAEEFLKAAGSTTYTDKRLTYTTIREFPQVRQSQKYGALLTKLESEFGLTPSARAGLNAAVTVEVDDPLLELFKRRSATNNN